MRMKDLVDKTGLTRETIHYYSREGLLPPYRKTSRNQADYDQEHVERVLMVKELQEKYFLPISVIKRIIQHSHNQVATDRLLKIKGEYLNLVDQLLPDDVTGEEEFLKLTGMKAERLANFEEWGLINPQKGSKGKVYSQDDVKIGKLIGEMRRLGVSYEKGYKSTGLKDYRDLFMPILESIAREFKQGSEGRFTRKELEQLNEAFIELAPVFFYYLSHIVLKQTMTAQLDSIGTTDEK